ncbi:MAG: hypothetical protein AAF387_08055 [Pseudomonadota bacterium]
MSNEPQLNSPNAPPSTDNQTGAFYEHSSKNESKRGETLKMIVVAFAIVLFALTLAVLFILPRFLPNSTNPHAPTVAEQAKPTETDNIVNEDEPSPTPSEQDTTAAAPITPVSNEERLAQRESAQTLLAEIDAKISNLDSQSVSKWGKDAFELAKKQIGEGEKAYSEQRYPEAVATYEKVSAALDTLAERGQTVLTESLAAGEYALASTDSDAALEAYEKALLIDPENEQALAGKRRAENLDEVLALVNEAKGFEDLGDLDAALARYQGALELDPETVEAEQAVKRINSQKANTAFNRAMSRGFEALEKRQYINAEKQFTAALKIKPNDSQAREALNQTKESARSAKIDRALRTAALEKQQENWGKVEAALLSAKRLDASISGINKRIDTARDRQTLERQLLKYTNEPHRLRNDDVHLEALSLLDKAKRYTAGPKLNQQIANLERTINSARTPFPVSLTSDGATNVTIYKVGNLGAFNQKTVTILPGKYVAVGKRAGFRDVRIEFNVDANGSAPTIDVRCVEALQFGS